MQLDKCSNSDFIYWKFLDEQTICDDVINYHKKSNNKTPGKIGSGVNKDKKDSLDVFLEGSLKDSFIKQLQNVCKSYINKFSFCNYYSAWEIVEPIQIQHYKPNGGYRAWHCERSLPELRYSQRHLVFMTYLNDVTDEGETEWFYQNLKIKPQKGLSVIWPVDWTYTHRGIPSTTQEKYIVTGWYSFTSTN